MTTILVIAAIYLVSIAFIIYEMKNAVVLPDDFEEETQPSAASKVKEVDEGFWSNTAAAI